LPYFRLLEVFCRFSFNISIVTTVSIAKKTINSTKKLVFSIADVTETLFKIGRKNNEQTIIFTVVAIKKDMPTESKLRFRTWNTVANIPMEKTPNKKYKLKRENVNVSRAIPTDTNTAW